MKYLILLILLLTMGCSTVTDNNENYHALADERVIIGVYVDNGAHPSCVKAAKKMFLWMEHEVIELTADAVNSGNISEIDLFYFPGGSSFSYCCDITKEGRDNLKKLISQGHGFIGTCAGALYAAEIQVEKGYSITYGQLGIFPGTATSYISEIYQDPDYGMCGILMDTTKTIAKGEPQVHSILYYNGPYFESDSEFQIIGSYEKINKPALISCTFGQGKVFLTGPHPEWEEDSNRDGVSYFDKFQDKGSDWPLMKKAVNWCLDLK